MKILKFGPYVSPNPRYDVIRTPIFKGVEQLLFQILFHWKPPWPRKVRFLSFFVVFGVSKVLVMSLTFIMTYFTSKRSFMTVFSHLELPLHSLPAFYSFEKLEADKFKEQQEQEQQQQEQQQQHPSNS